MRLLRTLRLDKSDTFVFERAAEPGEWACPGSFMFWEGDPAALVGKQRAAFRSGFLGVGSFGWSTLVEVAEVGPDDVEAAIASLARKLVAELGAPDIATARAAAKEEIDLSASLAEHPPGTVIALQRAVEPDGAVRERYRTIKTTLEPAGNTFAQGCVQPIDFEREDQGGGDEHAAPPVEEVDFLALMSERAGAPGAKERP